MAVGEVFVMACLPPWYYRCAIRLATPLYRLMVHQKSAKLPHYLDEVNARFGKAFAPTPAAPVIWCHAVSLGELNTAYPLLKILINQGFHLWITSTTQTGFARARTLFADELANGAVQHSFVPIDKTDVVERFIKHIQPTAVLFIETELWATTLFELAQRHIPTVMVNARLTDKSYQGYAKFGKLSRSMMANLSLIIAQDTASADRFVSLGADKAKVKCADSLKWTSPASLTNSQRAELAKLKSQSDNRPIWLAASTHDGEELSVLMVHERLLETMPNARLIIVPRHPERFEMVANLCRERGFDVLRRSLGQQLDDVPQGANDKKTVYLADSMGELMLWYAVCDVCLVGGSLVDKGGHTPIEPASVGTPIIMGQYTKNADVLVADLRAVGALVQVFDEQAFFDALHHWLSDKVAASHAGQAGQRLVHQKANAAQVQADFVQQVLPSCFNSQDNCELS
ncbi:MAG: 3-deoxy-D-manno-octulosonic acid transferase [Moraxella sp.]|nr:3-deoxy-D-manno-octulosonic acid transferase [Moraxella sp.]